MEIYFHLGFHKTGSTTFSHLCHRNASLLPSDFLIVNNLTSSIEPLKRACKALMARSTRAGQTEVTRAAAILVEDARRRGVRVLLVSSAGLAGSIPRPDRSQDLFANLPIIADALAAAAAEADKVEFIAVTRDADAWVRSLWGHLLRTRGVRPRALAVENRPSYLPSGLEGLVESIRARGHVVRAVQMEDDLPHRLGPGSSILRIIGLPDEELAHWEPVPRQNEGVPAAIRTRFESGASIWFPRQIRKLLARRLASARGSSRK